MALVSAPALIYNLSRWNASEVRLSTCRSEVPHEACMFIAGGGLLLIIAQSAWWRMASGVTCRPSFCIDVRECV